MKPGKKRRTFTFSLFCILVTGIMITGGISFLPSLDAETVELGGESTQEGGLFVVPNEDPVPSNGMRVIALGTGTPVLRRAQAAGAWLVELGNGDRFMFDLGSGAATNFNSLEMPHSSVKGIFLTHLHYDHCGDFIEFFFQGWLGLRLDPLHIYGPSGLTPALGTESLVEKQLESYAWDIGSRHGPLPVAGAVVEVHEFDYSVRPNQVVYDNNGVQITAFPAVHITDGPVSYRLDWNGLSFVYSGDLVPSTWLIDNSQEVDIFVCEAFLPPALIMPPDIMAQFFTFSHMLPNQAGKVFNSTNPRLGVTFHSLDDPATIALMKALIRLHYDGPIKVARDLMVFDVTPDTIAVRTVKPNNRPGMPVEPDYQAGWYAEKADPQPLSEWLKQGALDSGFVSPPPE